MTPIFPLPNGEVGADMVVERLSGALRSAMAGSALGDAQRKHNNYSKER